MLCCEQRTCDVIEKMGSRTTTTNPDECNGFVISANFEANINLRRWPSTMLEEMGSVIHTPLLENFGPARYKYAPWRCSSVRRAIYQGTIRAV
jgi:hypothetical protein